MSNFSIRRCEGCDEPISQFCGLVYTCPFCYEQYKRERDTSTNLVRLTKTPLPLTAEIHTKRGRETVNLRDIKHRLDNANEALNNALAEYKESCRIYESARPPISKRIRRLTVTEALKPLTKGVMFNCMCFDLWKYAEPAIQEWFDGATKIIFEGDYSYELTIKNISFKTTFEWHVDILIEVEETDALEGIYPTIARIE
jgi:hypothetical protein